MMGHTHAATGAAAWVAACATAAVLGHQPGPYEVIVGTPLAAFGAILPDIDCPQSSLAYSLGWPTRFLARRVAGFGRWLHAATRTRLDPPDEDGHRTITHTTLFPILMLAAFGVLGQHGGPWPMAVTAFAAATAMRALKLPCRYPVTAAVTAAGWMWPAPSGWWLGYAVGVGCLVHNLGDRMTNTGVPLGFPLTIRGRRWYKFKAMRWIRFETGKKGNPEPWIAAGAMLLCMVALAGMLYLRWPMFADQATEWRAQFHETTATVPDRVERWLNR